MWYVFQLAVFFGVLALFIENGITDLGMVPFIAAAFGALMTTVVLTVLIDLARGWKRSLLIRRDERLNDGGLPRV